MLKAPTHLKDAKDLLTKDGFKSSNIWYHGTSSALVDSIQKNGLKRSGDQALQDAAKKTMATIKHEYEERTEPVFLTQSKELAYYWAEQCVRERQIRLVGDTSNEETPVVFEITLPEDQNANVKPDVGAASLLLLEEGEKYMVYLASIYQEQDAGIPEIDLKKADRMEYQTTMGMVYLDADIDNARIVIVTV